MSSGCDCEQWDKHFTLADKGAFSPSSSSPLSLPQMTSINKQVTQGHDRRTARQRTSVCGTIPRPSVFGGSSDTFLPRLQTPGRYECHSPCAHCLRRQRTAVDLQILQQQLQDLDSARQQQSLLNENLLVQQQSLQSLICAQQQELERLQIYGQERSFPAFATR